MEQLEQPVEGAIPIGGASPNASSPVVCSMTVSNVPGVVLWSKQLMEKVLVKMICRGSEVVSESEKRRCV